MSQIVRSSSGSPHATESSPEDHSSRLAASGPDPSTSTVNLRVQHLPLNIDTAELHQMFECFGPVVAHKLMVDLRTGQSRGVAFVQFEREADAAAAATAMNGFVMGDRTLSVQYARDNARAPTAPTTKVVLRYVDQTTTEDRIREVIRERMPDADLDRVTIEPDQTPNLVLVYLEFATTDGAQRCVDALNRKVQLMDGTIPTTRRSQIVTGVPTSRGLIAMPVSAKLCDEVQQQRIDSRRARASADAGATSPSTGWSSSSGNHTAGTNSSRQPPTNPPNMQVRVGVANAPPTSMMMPTTTTFFNQPHMQKPPLQQVQAPPTLAAPPATSDGVTSLNIHHSQSLGQLVMPYAPLYGTTDGQTPPTTLLQHQQHSAGATALSSYYWTPWGPSPPPQAPPPLTMAMPAGIPQAPYVPMQPQMMVPAPPPFMHPHHQQLLLGQHQHHYHCHHHHHAAGHGWGDWWGGYQQ